MKAEEREESGRRTWLQLLLGLTTEFQAVLEFCTMAEGLKREYVQLALCAQVVLLWTVKE
jgi:hypothetical protein